MHQASSAPSRLGVLGTPHASRSSSRPLRVTELAVAARLRGASLRLMMDLQKAQACKESGKALQTLMDADVPVRTAFALSQVYGGSWKGFRGALHVKTHPLPGAVHRRQRSGIGLCFSRDLITSPARRRLIASSLFSGSGDRTAIMSRRTCHGTKSCGPRPSPWSWFTRRLLFVVSRVKPRCPRRRSPRRAPHPDPSLALLC